MDSLQNTENQNSENLPPSSDQNYEQIKPSVKEEEKKPEIKVEEQVKKSDGLSDSSDEEDKMTDDEKVLWDKINVVLKEYHLNAFQALAVRKFIKTKVADPNDKSVERLR